ncbi:hypothetical protein KNE206_42610 [Kitasatospora sp. NE20-6]
MRTVRAGPGKGRGVPFPPRHFYGRRGFGGRDRFVPGNDPSPCTGLRAGDRRRPPAGAAVRLRRDFRPDPRGRHGRCRAAVVPEHGAFAGPRVVRQRVMVLYSV